MRGTKSMQDDTKLALELEFEFSIKPSDIEEFSSILLEFHGNATTWDDDAEELSNSSVKAADASALYSAPLAISYFR